MDKYLTIHDTHTWLITGGAGFIGSHLAEALLQNNQRVRILDNFSTGKLENIEEVRELISEEQRSSLEVIRGNVQDASVAQQAVIGVDFILHQAALGSVPRSFDNPLDSNASNVTGFLTLLEAARRESERNGRIKSFVYASSSSVYGDHPSLPKREDTVGQVLSPYAASKRANELYAQAFAGSVSFPIIGLRYFNVFGPRQDPDGAYAAVIPRWINTILKGEPCIVYGDGETSRDFCYVSNVVAANILSALTGTTLIRETNTGSYEGRANVYNVAAGCQTSLLQLHNAIKEALKKRSLLPANSQLLHEEFRAGDVKHSLADISKISEALGYRPLVEVTAGLQKTVDWFQSK
ncbi:MAG: NAD-dependent epimerase/dehydratase family protein [Bdellovibrionota bacterium]